MDCFYFNNILIQILRFVIKPDNLDALYYPSFRKQCLRFVFHDIKHHVQQGIRRVIERLPGYFSKHIL